MSVSGRVEDIDCPVCGEKSLRIEMRLKPREIGTFSLSGAQMKVSAFEVPWLVCGICGAEAEGKREKR